MFLRERSGTSELSSVAGMLDLESSQWKPSEKSSVISFTLCVSPLPQCALHFKCVTEEAVSTFDLVSEGLT